MPLQINVGLNRKLSHNYNSEGVSINLTAELDQALLTKPAELQQKIDYLYAEAHNAIDRQLGQSASAPQRDNGNGEQKFSPATQSQLRAINAIAARLNIDATDECRHEFGLDLNRLSIREASQLIDHLKQLQPAPGNGNGHARNNGGCR